MASYGYARVSTLDQDLPIQRVALKAAGCTVVRAEKASGSRRDGRTELQVLLDFVQPGDTLVVTRIDRLARSMKDLQDIAKAMAWAIASGEIAKSPMRFARASLIAGSLIDSANSVRTKPGETPVTFDAQLN
jgi:hypothetical protein